jgi:hypothetical protein
LSPNKSKSHFHTHKPFRAEPGGIQGEPEFSRAKEINEVFYVEHGHKFGGRRR